jgi:hypothetical protein
MERTPAGPGPAGPGGSREHTAVRPAPGAMSVLAAIPFALVRFYLRWCLLVLIAGAGRGAMAGSRRWARWERGIRAGRDGETMSRIDYLAFRYLASRWPARTAVALVTLPVHAPARAVGFARRMGSTARTHAGLGTVRQVLDIWLLALRFPLTFGSNPRLYYTQEAYRPERRADAALVLSDMHHAALCRSIAGREVRAMSKSRFEQRCAELDVPYAASIARITRGGEVIWTGDRRSLPEADLFSKPVHGTRGVGAARWVWEGAGTYRSEAGEVLGAEAVLRSLKAASQGGEMIVQRRLRNHPALEAVVGSTLATVRMLTVLDGPGELEFVLAVYRSAAGNGAVDNFTQGGIACAVDIATGELGTAVSVGPSGMQVHETHPVTGARLAGIQLPGWTETLSLIEHVHTSGFERNPVVGWDVALTPSGPVLIEGNPVPGIRSLQAAHRVGLGRLPYTRRLLSLFELRVERS